MQKGFWLALVAIVIILGGLFVLAGGKEDTAGNPYAYTEPFTKQANDHVTGTGPVQLIEYGDFQCSGCAGVFPIISELKSTMGEQMTFTFRHFPLVRTHPHAMAAHRAAEAAAKQGKFWEMHDALFTTQQQWNNLPSAAPFFESIAQQLGLNVEQFKTDAATEDTFKRIEADQQSGQALGTNSTPTFYLNGQKIDEVPRTVEDWQKLINDAAKQQAS